MFKVIRSIFVLGWFGFAAFPVFSAETPIEIQGIMPGDEPLAIVNGNVVKPGDRVEGMTVEYIGEQTVRFCCVDGKEVEKTITAKKTDTPKVKNIPADAGVAVANKPGGPVPAQPGPVLAELSRARDIALEAEQLEKKTVLSVADLEQIIGLYDRSQREAQAALAKAADPGMAEDIKKVIAAMREQRSATAKKKQELEAVIRKAITDHKVAIGMTKNDVVRSWGKPAKINTGKYSRDIDEEWIYERVKSKRVQLYLSTDICVAAQTPR
jgi:hypothetical protein